MLKQILNKIKHSNELSVIEPTQHATEEDKRNKEEKKERLIKTLEELSNTELGYSEICTKGHHNFEEWYNSLKKDTNQYSVRGELYYGIQALFDVLINETIKTEKREDTIIAFNNIVAIGKDYLAKLYTGKANIEEFREKINTLYPSINIIFDAPYNNKHRSSDADADEYRQFQMNYLKSIVEEKLPLPDSIISVACGGNDLAMTASEFTGADLGFVRYSKRRNDSKVKIIPEHKEYIKEIVSGKNIACIEDWVDTGKSLKGVMNSMDEYNPLHMIGLASGWNNSSSAGLKIQYEKHRWKAFKK